MIYMVFGMLRRSWFINMVNVMPWSQIRRPSGLSMRPSIMHTFELDASLSENSDGTIAIPSNGGLL